MANPIWRTVGKLIGTAVISGAGMEAGRRVFHGFLDKAGWETPKDAEQDDELRELQKKVAASELRHAELEAELKALREQLDKSGG
jgi:hypothetical protein